MSVILGILAILGFIIIIRNIRLFVESDKEILNQMLGSKLAQIFSKILIKNIKQEKN